MPKVFATIRQNPRSTAGMQRLSEMLFGLGMGMYKQEKAEEAQERAFQQKKDLMKYEQDIKLPTESTSVPQLFGAFKQTVQERKGLTTKLEEALVSGDTKSAKELRKQIKEQETRAEMINEQLRKVKQKRQKDELTMRNLETKTKLNEADLQWYKEKGITPRQAQLVNTLATIKDKTTKTEKDKAVDPSSPEFIRNKFSKALEKTGDLEDFTAGRGYTKTFLAAAPQVKNEDQWEALKPYLARVIEEEESARRAKFTKAELKTFLEGFLQKAFKGHPGAEFVFGE